MFAFGIGIICFALGMVTQHKLCVKKMKDITNSQLLNIAKKLEES